MTTLPGSVPIGAQTHGRVSARRAATSGITVAESYAPAEVSAKVTGSGRDRKVVWSAKHLAEAGRTLRFVETDASGLEHVLKETSAASGSMPFTVADGKAGKRSIAAVVIDNEGMAISSTPVATFTAPGYVLPAKASKLKLKLQKKDKLSVTWAGKRSKSWLVLVTAEDGRRLRIVATKNAVTIPEISRKEKVAITVVGVDAHGSEGEARDCQALAQDQRRRRTSNVIGGSAIASCAATSWISRVPAAMVFSRMAKTEDVVRASAVSAEPVAAQVGEVERGGHVAAAVGRDRQQRGLDRPGAVVGDREHVEATLGDVAVQDAGDQQVARAAVADLVGGGQDVGEGAGLAAGEEVELEVVGREDVGLRHHGVAHELRDPGPHEHPATDVAHHRVAAVDRVRVELLHPRDRVEDDPADGRVALVAREHRVGLAEHAAVVDAGDHVADVARPRGAGRARRRTRCGWRSAPC